MALKNRYILGIKCNLVILNLGGVSKIHFINKNRWGRRKAEMDDGPVPWNLKWIIPPEGSGVLQ